MIERLPFSSYVLIAANMIPLIGVIFFEWDAVLVLALFWIENLIIGGFNIVRIISAGLITRKKEAILTTVFFIFHYGLFCSVHGQLLTDILNYPAIDYRTYFSATDFGLLELFLEGAAVLMTFIDRLSPTIWLGITALLLSRLVSFIENFLLRGDIFSVRINKLMVEPYNQIIVMHIGLIAGAALLEKLQSPVWLLAIIVVLKMFFDFHQHKKRHERTDERIKDI